MGSGSLPYLVMVMSRVTNNLSNHQSREATRVENGTDHLTHSADRRRMWKATRIDYISMNGSGFRVCRPHLHVALLWRPMVLMPAKLVLGDPVL